MARLKILLPDATVNYIKNPSLRYDATDWSSQGSTVTRIISQARFGVASLQVVTNGAALHEGVYFRVSALDGISDVVTVSAYVRGSGLVRIRLDDNAPGGQEYTSQAVQLDDERWTRIDVTGHSHGGDDLRLYVETDEGVAIARTFYIDGAQMERKPYSTTYCDGDQDGCRWGGIYHASSSSREASTRKGGRWVELSGSERESEDLYMTTAGGLGAAPLTNNVQDYALQPGAFHQNIKVNVRPITFTFHAKHKNLLRTRPVSLERLHELRQMLIDVVKPDLTAGDEPIQFEYVDGSRSLYFWAHYDGGLEGDWDVRNANINSFPLRLLAVNPVLFEDSQDAHVLDFQDSFAVNYFAARIDETWQNMNFGFNHYPLDSVFDERRRLYAVGDSSLTVANNNAGAIDPLLAIGGRAFWNGESWEQFGGTAIGGAFPNIYCVFVASNGYIYVGGDFTSIGGVAANRIAYWNGSSWNALGSGLNAICYQIGATLDGKIVAVGSFTTAGGLNAYYAAIWDGSSWHRMGQYGGLNSTVRALAVPKDGSNVLYVGGDFTDENGNPGSGLNRVAAYNLDLGTFSAMANGFDGSVAVMGIDMAGDVYAGGSFTLSGSADMKGVSRWNGSAWLSLGSGLLAANGVGPGSVDDLSFFSDGRMIVVGIFGYAGGIPMNNIGFWNGSSWSFPDIQLATTQYTCVDINPETDDIFIGMIAAAGEQALTGAKNTITNQGSMAANPSFYITGPCTLRYIENTSNKKRMNFNLQVESGESVIIDTGNGTIISNLRGNILYTLISGSDFVNFVLQPGENEIVCFMIDDVGAQISMQLPVLHWSVDATSDGETL